MVLQGSCQLLHVQAAIRPIRAFVAKRVRLEICAFLGLFGADFYADIWDLTQILRRYLDQKSAADSSAHLSDCYLLLQETKKI